jgi:hypothetical protein
MHHYPSRTGDDHATRYGYQCNLDPFAPYRFILSHPDAIAGRYNGNWLRK